MYPYGRDILVIDAETERRERIARILAAEGFAVATAADPLSALRTLSARRYALVITTVELPGSVDGPAIVRRARRRLPALKALYLARTTRWPALADPDREDLLAMPFERWGLIGCTFELLERERPSETADLARRMRTERRVS